jgi:hypothetical protein
MLVMAASTGKVVLIVLVCILAAVLLVFRLLLPGEAQVMKRMPSGQRRGLR